MKTEREWIIQTAAAEYAAAAALRTGSRGFLLSLPASPPAHLQLHIYFILHLYFSHLLFPMAEQIRAPSNLSSLLALSYTQITLHGSRIAGIFKSEFHTNRLGSTLSIPIMNLLLPSDMTWSIRILREERGGGYLMVIDVIMHLSLQ